MVLKKNAMKKIAKKNLCGCFCGSLQHHNLRNASHEMIEYCDNRKESKAWLDAGKSSQT